MEQPPLTQEPQAEAPLPPAMSLGGRLLNVFATPGEVFQEVKTASASTANWLVPAVVFLLVGWMAGWMVYSQDSIKHQLTEITDQTFQKEVEAGHMSEQRAEQTERWAVITRKMGAVAAPVFVGFVTPFGWGLILWLVGAKILKGDFPYLKAVEVVGLASMIDVLGSIVTTLLMVGMGSVFASPSLVLLVKDFDPHNLTHSLLAIVNVMTFWLLAVRAIGLARLSGVSIAKAALWVFGIWVAYTGLLIGLAALVQAALKRMGA